MRPLKFENGAVPEMVGVMVLLDRSSSMAIIRTAMTEAFDAFIAEQRAVCSDGMWLTLHQFDGEGYDVTYNRKPLATVGGLNLVPRGDTPLRDALWRFGEAARAVMADATDETERLLLVVVTDGQENASRLHTWAEVRALLQSLDVPPACELIWLGTTAALLEAQDQVATVFTQPGATMPFAPTAAGTAYAVGGLRAVTMSMRAGMSTSKSALADYDRSDGATASTAEALVKLVELGKRKKPVLTD